MIRPRRRLLLVALVCGTLVGAAAAAVRDSDERAALRTSAPLERSELDPLAADRVSLVPRRDTARLDLRVSDPSDGPDWAVRVWDAKRGERERPVRCAELGRVHEGEFGWVFPDGSFRALPLGVEHTLARCSESGGTAPFAELTTTLRFPEPSEPRLERTVLWGRFPPGSSRVRARGLRGEVTETGLGRAGALLVLADPATRSRDVSVEAVLPGGGPWSERFGSGESGRPGRLLGSRIVPGSERLEAPAPDPAGGPPWGVVVAERQGGGTCVGGEARAVEGRIGELELWFGLLTDHHPSLTLDCRPRSVEPTRSRPLDIGWGGGTGAVEAGGDPIAGRARTERRVVPGRLYIKAWCHSDVERVTIRTPRDIRTLVPSPGGVVLAVYDGSIASGEATLTAHLRDGGTYRQTIPLGF